MQHQLSSGLTIESETIAFSRDAHGLAYYVRAEGPTSLLWRGEVINGHDQSRHPQGFSAPIGMPDSLSSAGAWHAVTDQMLIDRGLVAGNTVQWRYPSGVVFQAKYLNSTRLDGVLVLMTFDECSITAPSGDVLYDPSWGQFDLAVAE